MALRISAVRALLLALALTQIHLSTCKSVKGFVSCLHCTPHHDLSGVRVAVKCSNERRTMYALTNKEGYFEAEIPTNSSPPSSPSPKCLAMLLGGSVQLCAFKKSMVSKIVKARGSENSYGLSTPLSFFISCPSKADSSKTDVKAPLELGSGKPINFPHIHFPALADMSDLRPPAIFLFPFIPIIGIP